MPTTRISSRSTVTFAVPVLLLSRQPGFRIEHVWILSVASVLLQAVLSLVLLRGQLQRRLAPFETPAVEPATAAARA